MDESCAYLGHGPIATGGDNQLASVAHSLARQFGGMSRSLGLLELNVNASFCKGRLDGVQGCHVCRQPELAASVRVDDQPRRRVEARYVEPVETAFRRDSRQGHVADRLRTAYASDTPGKRSSNRSSTSRAFTFVSRSVSVCWMAAVA